MNLKPIYNLGKMRFKIEPVTPLLIKSRETIDPTRPEMEFVRLITPYGETVHIPGSSLKGAIRSHCERLCRSLGLDVCDILDTRREGNSCIGRHRRNQRETKGRMEEITPYRAHCCICRTFGSMNLASRVLFSDAFPWSWDAEEREKEKAIEEINKFINIRPGTAIDRRKGSVKGGALWEMEVLAGGTFYCELTIRNYQLYQLALILLSFHHLNAGLQKLGFGKTRGLGRVKVSVEELEIQQYPLLNAGKGKICGIGIVQGLQGEYDLVDNDEVDSPVCQEESLLFHRFSLAESEAEELLQKILSSKHWKAFQEKFKGGEN
jgi:CRISPR-associated RAMP protein (TIGR02581 family)